jgi:protease-4
MPEHHISLDLHNPKCFNSHLGIWAIESMAGRARLEAVQSGLLAADRDNLETGLLTSTFEGIRIIPIEGSMQKGRSKFGGTSTIDVRRELHIANRDDDVRGIMLLVDSPGGHASGTQALFKDVANSAKPVRAHVDDLAASAALWGIAAVDRISADETAVVGSIGVFSVLMDTSKAQEQDGVELHLVSTGPFKGAGADGKVTDELLAEVQKRVDDVNEFFLSSVADGRDMSRETVEALATGEVFNANESLSNGLIDSVSDFQTALVDFASELAPKSKANAAKKRISIARQRQRG